MSSSKNLLIENYYIILILLHIVQRQNLLIMNVEATTASVHDSEIDLGIEGIPCYADRAYDGVKTRRCSPPTDSSVMQNQYILHTL